MLTCFLEGYFTLEICLKCLVSKFQPEAVGHLELGISLGKIPDQLECMEEGMILGARLQHYLVTIANLVTVKAGGRPE